MKKQRALNWVGIDDAEDWVLTPGRGTVWITVGEIVLCIETDPKGKGLTVSAMPDIPDQLDDPPLHYFSVLYKGSGDE